MSTEWKPDTRAYLERWLEEAAQSGEVELRARRLGISYGDAAISLAEELERPYKEIEEKYKKRSAPVPDEETINLKAEHYAAKHNCSYEIALDSVIGTTPGAKRAVELEEAPTPHRECYRREDQPPGRRLRPP